MKKLLLISVVLGIMVAPVLAVPTVTLSRTIGAYDSTIFSGRGEWTLTPNSELSWVLSSYVPATRFGDSFESFCLELGEPASPGSTYDAVLNDTAIWGGVGPEGDPLSIGTAYLYHEFQKGTLEGYDYTLGAGRVASARDLQRTIWYLEDEGAEPFDNEFTDLVIAEFGTLANAKADNDSSIPVGVLNLTNVNGSLRQDMLVCIPVIPAPGAILLGGIGVSIVGWMRRRRTL